MSVPLVSLITGSKLNSVLLHEVGEGRGSWQYVVSPGHEYTDIILHLVSLPDPISPRAYYCTSLIKNGGEKRSGLRETILH